MNFHPAGSISRPSRRLVTLFDRMVAAEVSKTLVAVLSVLVLIIVSKRFLKILALAIEGDVSGQAIFVLLGLKITAAAITLLPPAIFVAVLMTLGRMYRDSEMPVLAGAGVGVGRTYQAVGLVVVPLAALSAVLALYVLPWSDATTRELFVREERLANIRGIKEGKFAESNNGKTVFYVEELKDNTHMRNIFVQSSQHGREGVVASDSGFLKTQDDGEQFLILRNGIRYDGKPGTAEFVITDFEEYGVRIDAPSDADDKSVERASLASEALLASGKPRDIAELQKRVAVPLGIIALSLLAVPLARLAPRSGVYGNLFAAFLIYLGYENLQRIGQGMVIGDKVPAVFGGMLVYLVTFATVSALLVHNLGWRWIVECLQKGVRR